MNSVVFGLRHRLFAQAKERKALRTDWVPAVYLPLSGSRYDV